MYKPNSVKLRTLLTLRALLKYSDEQHRMNSVTMNEHLRPYGLECHQRVLGETVSALREFGFDIRRKGYKQGFWMEERPLSDDAADRLVFAVTTNPYLSEAQANEALQSLKPFVTVYREGKLAGMPHKTLSDEPSDTLYKTYTIVREAIAAGRRVQYTVDNIKYIRAIQAVEKCEQWYTLFTPKQLCQSKDGFYMIGYNHVDECVMAVNLRDIISIRIPAKMRAPKADEIDEQLGELNPADFVPCEQRDVVYEGPVTFQCRGQYVSALFRRFGEPDGPVVKNSRCRTTYNVKSIKLTSEDLFWLSQIPGNGIRMVGPTLLKEAVQAYYQQLADQLITPIPKIDRS